ncbi:hypothetical protein ACET6W_17020 [Aeromonas veronii]
MFIDLNLKSADDAAMSAALIAVGFLKDKQGHLYHPSAALMLLPPGMVTRLTGEVMVVDGMQIDVREPVPGYHANVRTTDATLAAALAPVTVVVESPQYVWA